MSCEYANYYLDANISIESGWRNEKGENEKCVRKFVRDLIVRLAESRPLQGVNFNVPFGSDKRIASCIVELRCQEVRGQLQHDLSFVLLQFGHYSAAIHSIFERC
jgi:hypothetical protein